jgi:hypothetical protein
MHSAGSSVQGRYLNAHGRFAHSDSRRLHSTVAFQGERYVIIFYVAPRWQSTPPEARAELER